MPCEDVSGSVFQQSHVDRYVASRRVLRHRVDNANKSLSLCYDWVFPVGRQRPPERGKTLSTCVDYQVLQAGILYHRALLVWGKSRPKPDHGVKTGVRRALLTDALWRLRRGFDSRTRTFSRRFHREVKSPIEIEP